jgi:tyrosyl-tRNA synthetase
MKKINQEQIDEAITRGIANVYPTPEFLKSKLSSGKKVTIYLGIDPTGPTLHLGHSIPILKLKQFQKLGHKVILLMGDFTAMIGDPTDKSAARVALTHKQVMANLKNYKKQVSTLLNFTGANKAEIKFNSKWLGKMSFEDGLKLASNMTVQQMIERDMFSNRMKEGKPIYIHEFFYPLMQGYDSVAMNVDGEVGGNDQTFNMLAGRTLMKALKNKEKFVISMKLLEDSSGKKMGKTEGNMLALSDSPEEMFGKVMSWSDGMIIPGFELCTDTSIYLLEGYARDMTTGAINPRDLKMMLGKKIVSMYYNEKLAEKAQASFTATFQKKEIPDDMEEVKLREGALLADLLLEKKVVASKGEFARLVKEGAVTNLTANVKIEDIKVEAFKAVYKIGKKRFIKIV